MKLRTKNYLIFMAIALGITTATLAMENRSRDYAFVSEIDDWDWDWDWDTRHSENSSPYARRPNLNTISNSNELLIEASIQHENNFIIKAIEAGADVNHQNDRDWTALMYAVCYGKKNKELIELLIRKGANVNSQSRDGETALSLSISLGRSYEIFKLLIDADANIHTTKNSFWGGPLVRTPSSFSEYRILDRHEELEKMVQLLVDKGAPINDTNSMGDTALICTSIFDAPTIAKILIKARAAMDIANERHKTALSEASDRGHVEMVKLLLDAGTKE